LTEAKRLYQSQLFTAYNKARAAARSLAGDPSKLLDRLNKALGILQSAGYYSSQESADYQPSTFGCGCKDWRYRHAAKRQYNGPCKHMLAEGLHISAASTNVLFTHEAGYVSIQF
jgi:hypothetical protein